MSGDRNTTWGPLKEWRLRVLAVSKRFPGRGPELREEEPRSIDGANDACSIVRDAKSEALGNLSLLY